MKTLTVQEAADRIQRTRAAVYAAIRKGLIKPERRHGVLLVSGADVDRYASISKRGRPRVTHSLPTDISQAELARRLGVSRQRVNQMLRQECHRARALVYVALGTGKLVRPETCSLCKLPKTVQAHHHDYSKPLKVRWLCAECHRLVHQHRPVQNGSKTRK